MMENLSYGEVIGNHSAPFLNGLARRGALFTNSRAIGHPSEPNYLALFSGSTHGVTADSCPLRFTGPNLASELIAAGHTFTGYAEDLPGTGSPVCTAGEYARKHVPWVNFTTVPGLPQQAVQRVRGGGLRAPAHGLLRHPESLPRHARLPGGHR